MESILKKSEQPAVEEMIEFLKDLTEEEQQQLNIFIQGVKFAQKLELKEPA